MTRYEMVARFNSRILGIEPGIGPVVIHEDYELSHVQLIEEAEEFLDACERGNTVDAIDAVIDSIYFAYGILYKMGVSEKLFNAVFDLIHEANMEKALAKEFLRTATAAGKDAAKPEGWVGPEEEIGKLLK